MQRFSLIFLIHHYWTSALQKSWLLLPFIYPHILFDTVYQYCTFRYKSIRSMNLQIMTQVPDQSKSLIFVMILFLITVQKHVSLLRRAFRYSFFSQDKEVAVVFPGSFLWLIIKKNWKSAVCATVSHKLLVPLWLQIFLMMLFNVVEIYHKISVMCLVFSLKCLFVK